MSILNKVLSDLNDRRERAVSGKYNCIPLPFTRFKNLLPGIEKGKYIILTANQKVGKSKLCDYMFIYDPLFFVMENPELKIKILYFTLEIAKDVKYKEFMSYLLYRLDNLHVSVTELNSTNKDKPIDANILELLKSDRYKKYLDAYENMVTYIDDTKNPTGIMKKCKENALAHGHFTYRDGMKRNETGEFTEGTVRDEYVFDDPEEYRIIILDNASNLANEKGMDKRETIDTMSKYAIELRNIYKYTFVLVQHQAQAQEGTENIKLNRTFPTSDGLADCKTTTRDVNLILGLYNPAKYRIAKYNGYDITKFGNHIRFLSVLEDRDYGASGNECALFFDGASSYFIELPRPEERDVLQDIYDYIQRLDNRTSYVFFALNKNFVKKVAKFNIKRYLCSLFHKNKE